ncbi:MAG: hypothetical protein WA821_13725 [Anaerolineales bacterium]
MSEFLSNLSSVSWWLGVVVVGIGINIISPYFKIGLEKILIKTSNNFRNKALERSEKRKRRIDELKANQHKQIMFGFKEQRLRIRALYEFLCGLLFSILGFFLLILATIFIKSNFGILVDLFAGLIILYSLSQLLVGINDTGKFIEIRNILNEIDPDIADADIVDWL